MRVLVVVPDTAGCGAERQAFLHMSALRTESHSVLCVCSENSWLSKQCERAGIACEPRRIATGWLDGRAIGRYAKAQSVDVVFGYGEQGIRVASKVARNCGAKAYAVAFDSIDERYLKGVSGVFAGSQSLCAALESTSDAPVIYLPPAVPDTFPQFSERRESERQRLKLDDNHIAVCVPGPIHPDLGQEIALEALEQLGGQQLRLFMLGSYQHQYGKDIRLLAAQNPVAANSMIGQPADGGIYAAFDVCLAPFQAAHAAQHALTAMSFGLPLVATPTGALQDMVTPGGNGYLATSNTTQSVAEALLVTLDEGNGLVAMGKRSRKMFKEQYSLRHMARSLNSLLSESESESANA